MSPVQIETLYDALALQLDQIAPENRELFLAKLALLLGREVGNIDIALRAIASAAEYLHRQETISA